MGVLYGFASASVKQAIIVLIYASCKSEIAHVSWLCMTCILSNQLMGPRSVSTYHSCSFPLYTTMSLGELLVIVQLSTCTARTSMCFLMCTTNTPGSALATWKPKSVTAVCNTLCHLHLACFKPYSALSTSAKINISYSILFNLTTSYSSYFGGKKGISRNKISFFLLTQSFDCVCFAGLIAQWFLHIYLFIRIKFSVEIC